MLCKEELGNEACKRCMGVETECKGLVNEHRKMGLLLYYLMICNLTIQINLPLTHGITFGADCCLCFTLLEIRVETVQRTTAGRVSPAP